MADPEEISKNIVAISAGDSFAGYCFVDLL